MKKIKNFFTTEEQLMIGLCEIFETSKEFLENGWKISDDLQKDVDYVTWVDDDCDTWIDPSYFRKKYKSQLERKGKISCSHCRYNRGENQKFKTYWGHSEISDDDALENLKMPSWKLVSKTVNNELKNQ